MLIVFIKHTQQNTHSNHNSRNPTLYVAVFSNIRGGFVRETADSYACRLHEPGSIDRGSK